MVKIANDFIKDGEAERLNLKNSEVLRMFGVNPNTYSSYCKRLAGAKEKEEALAKKAEQEEKLDKQIMREISRVIKERNGVVPGKRTLQVYLLVNHKRYLSIRKCEKYLKKMGLYARALHGNHYKGQDTYYHQCLAHPNLVMQHFYLGYREVILTDITYIFYDLKRKVCYHCLFYDPFTDQVLGEATSEKMDVELIKAAYQDMIDKHGDELRNKDRVFIHSDNGSQFIDVDFKELIEEENFDRSFSRRATPGDNRPCEALNGRIKLELSGNLLRCPAFKTVKDMISNYHKDRNENRVNLYLGGLTPNQYQEYLLTGVYALDKYYDIDASKLYPVHALVKRLKGLAEERQKKSRDEQRSHREKIEILRDLLKRPPEDIVASDRFTALREHASAENRKLAADADMVLWAKIEEEVKVAVDFVMKADAETREKLKDRANWANYTELSYIHDFPSYAVGKDRVDKSMLSKNMSEMLDLWVVLDAWFQKAVAFITEADADVREAIKDRTNWKNYPEIALLASLEEETVN